MGDGFNAYMQAMDRNRQIRYQAFENRRQKILETSAMASQIMKQKMSEAEQKKLHENQYIAVAEKIGAFDPSKYTDETPVEKELKSTIDMFNQSQVSNMDEIMNTAQEAVKLGHKYPGGLVPGTEEKIAQKQKNIERIEKLKAKFLQAKESPEFQTEKVKYIQSEFLKNNPVGSPEYYKIMMDFENAKKEETLRMKEPRERITAEQSIPEIAQLQSLQEKLPELYMVSDEDKFNVKNQIEAVKEKITQAGSKKERAELVRQAQQAFNAVTVPDYRDIEPPKAGIFSKSEDKKKRKDWEERQKAKSATPDADKLLGDYQK